MEQQRRWLSLDEAADFLKVGVPTVQRLIDRGLLHAQPGAQPPLVSYEAILAFLRSDQRRRLHEEQPPSSPEP
jgi:excisionase family DNA binding protein